MKKILTALMFALLYSFLSYSQETQTFTRIEPEFTTVDRLVNLKAGMTKEEVFTTLGVYPYDILYNQENSCEIHLVKYAKTKRRFESRVEKPGSNQQLSDGEPFYTNLDEVAVYYRNGALEAFIVESLEKTTYEILNYDDFLTEKCNPKASAKIVDLLPPPLPPAPPTPVVGCMDPLSLNFNPKATQDDGSCRYCDCGYVKASSYEHPLEMVCPECLPSKDLWQYWIKMERCDLIMQWIETYPPLIKNVPDGFLDNCKPKKPIAQKDECTWCKLFEKENIKIQLNEVDVKLKNATK